MFYLLIGLLAFALGLIIVVLILAGVIAYPAFRIAIIVVVFGALWAISSLHETAQKNRIERAVAEEAAATAIKLGDLKMEDVKLRGDDPSYVLDGLVTNMSGFKPATIYFEITINNCDDNNCRVVGQEKTSVNVYVPAGQARAFHSDRMLFDNLPPLNGAKRPWDYKIIKAKSG
jgi:hypothetical protein